jgi:hypothetical protein
MKHLRAMQIARRSKSLGSEMEKHRFAALQKCGWNYCGAQQKEFLDWIGSADGRAMHRSTRPSSELVLRAPSRQP